MALAGCGDATSPTPPEPVGPLPEDPQQWICRDKHVTTQAEIDAWCQAHPDRGSPVPDDVRNPPPPSDFDAYQSYSRRLETFLTTQEYTGLGWIHDRNWRLSGPSIVGADGGFGNNYGPHYPLRVYYSPEVVDWLCNGRQGAIPDGAMIIKEMNLLFPLLDVQRARDGCMDLVDDPAHPIQPVVWAPMLKTSQSYDGWYWMLPAIDIGLPPQFPPPLIGASAFTVADFPVPIFDADEWYPTGSSLQNVTKPPNVVELMPLAGHPYCLSCHASAQSESTFASMDNILGHELRYKAYDPVPGPSPAPPGGLQPFPRPLRSPQQAFLELFHQMSPVGFPDVWQTRMPAETYNKQVISAHDGPGEFLTAAQCGACHDATPQNPLFPQMVLLDQPPWRTSPLRNLSPYGEWRVSAMGLSGRDPVFFAQLQSETNRLASQTACIENTCLRCHGVMGGRQFASDTASQGDPACTDMYTIPPPPEVPFGQPFRRDALQQWLGSSPNDRQLYGALGRDGVSCTVCHHVAEANLGDERSYTGNFVTGPANEINGPYQDDSIVTKPMEHALGLTPRYGEQITNPELCGSCHNILLPVLDNAGNRLGAKYEQSTELEWQNSEYSRAGDDFRSCQDCHMPTTYKGTSLAFKIANNETNLQFPPTTNRLPDDEIALTKRDHFARHSLHGLNVFLNQFFQQFPLVLGFQQIDWMSEQASSIDPPAPVYSTGYPMELPLMNAFDSMLEMAGQQTAMLDIEQLDASAGGITALLKVHNATGHYLPTGVGFRRMFLEVVLLDAQGATLWASGRTNDLGFILDGTSDRVLDSEQPTVFPKVPPQPHYQTIDSGSEAQIYQEVILDSADEQTTSFLRRVKIIKDNRVRPEGFDPQAFAQSDSPYVRELAVLHGAEADDPYYSDPSLTGADEIQYRIALDPQTLARADHLQATLYYQSIPPFYLQQRFADAGLGAAAQDDIQRLYYLTSHLNIAGATDVQGNPVLTGWKLRLAGATRGLR
jgi:hypothetical protein